MSHWYETPLDPPGVKRASYTTWLSVFDNQFLISGAAKRQARIIKDAWWESYIGLTQFKDREHFDEFTDTLPTFQDEWDEEADGGSFVHNALEFYFKEGFTGDHEDLLNFLSDYFDPIWIKYLATAFNALIDNKIQIVNPEMTVWNTDGGAGTLDFTCMWDDAFGISDYKLTPYPISWKAWAQLEGYRRAYTYMTHREPVFRMVIRICKEEKKRGMYEILVRPLEVDTQIRIWHKYNRKAKKYEVVRELQSFPCDHEEDYAALLAARTIFFRSRKK